MCFLLILFQLPSKLVVLPSFLRPFPLEMASLCETDFYNSSYESQQQSHLSLTEVAAVVVEEAAVRCMAWEVGSNPSEKAASDMTLVLCPWAINREPE